MDKQAIREIKTKTSKTDADHLGTWTEYDILAKIPGRGWVKIGEIGNGSVAGWSGRDHTGELVGMRWTAWDTRRDAVYEITEGFKHDLLKGIVDPATYQWCEA